MANNKFEIADYPKNGRVDEYQKELFLLEKAQNMEKMLVFANRLFDDCSEYLKKTYNLQLPKAHLYLVNHKVFSEKADKIDAMCGAIPRHRAMTVFTRFSPPKIYIDFQSHIEGHQPVESVVSLCMDYIEELIHTSDPTKNEIQIHNDVCLAIEDFLKIKIPDSLKQYRIEYAKTCDNAKPEK